MTETKNKNDARVKYNSDAEAIEAKRKSVRRYQKEKIKRIDIHLSLRYHWLKDAFNLIDGVTNAEKLENIMNSHFANQPLEEKQKYEKLKNHEK